MKQVQSFVGKRFGALTVMRVNGTRFYTAEAACECDCGNSASVPLTRLMYGHTKSCGCYRNGLLLKHGQSKTRLYRIWTEMVYRCNNPNNASYSRYGGRGIRVCDDWLNFLSFWQWSLANGYSYDLSIDRIDNDGNYCPENCRWADNETQMNNQRRTHYLTHNGKTQSMAQWSRESGIPYSILDGRINKLGWTAAEALTAKKGTKLCSIRR